jgi:hypothetical protein
MLNSTFRTSGGQFKKFLSFGAAFLATAALASAALSPAEQEINRKIKQRYGNSVNINSATPDQIVTATQDAVNDASIDPAIKTSALISAAVRYAPRRSPELAGIGLNDIQADNTLGALDRQNQAKSITASTIRGALAGSDIRFRGGVNDNAAGAAAVTSIAVTAVKDSAFPELLGNVVSSAVSTATALEKNLRPQPPGGKTGAAGAALGAVAQVAGVSNDNITDQDADDSVTKRVIRTAVQSAPNRVAAIAKAVAYSFAFTYLVTTTDGTEDSAATFRQTNFAALVNIIKSGLKPDQRAKFHRVIAERVRAGIALAYTGAESSGSRGINNFAYNNGQGTPVTDVQGL